MAGYFELKKSGASGYMFNLKAGNHEIILTSESYTSKAMAKVAISSVRTNSLRDNSYSQTSGADGKSYFVLKASNGAIIGKSEIYNSVSAMQNGIESVKTNGQTTEVKEFE